MRLRTTVLMIAIAAVFAVMAASAFADDYYVATTGSNTTGDGSSGNPWLTITYALAHVTGSAANPHTIHIAAGRYDSSIRESYPLNMESYVSLSGADEATTILDAKNVGYHVIFCFVKKNFTIENLTITGGNANASSGMGHSGGGIFCISSSLTLTNCTIRGNRAHYGGGIYCDDSSPTLTNCTISGNRATYRGGGIDFYYFCSSTLTNCSITGNWSGESGGGIHCEYGDSPSLTNCTIADNDADAGGGIYCDDSNCQPTVLNSILWGDSPDEIAGVTSGVSVTYSDVEGGWSGTGNMDDNPLFVAGQDGDYYLSHEDIDGVDSPCIDAGYGALDDYGLYPMTTCADGRTDGNDDGDSSTGPIDMGVHYAGLLEYYVDALSGNDSNSGRDWDDAFATIGKAIEECSESWLWYHCNIHVAAGTYYDNIELDSHLTLLGGYPTGGGTRNPAANETSIDGGAVDTVVTIDSKTDVMIDGFTIQNGSATYGGGIYCRGSDLTVTACMISDNAASEFGGAIYFEASSVEMSNCIVMNNAAEVGGGMFCYDESSVELLNCMIAHNMADYGAGIYCCSDSSASLTNCTIADNVASGSVGGIYSEGFSSVEVLNSIIYDNEPEQLFVTPTSSIAITYSCVQGGYSGTGNIDEDPGFVPTSDPPFEYYLAHTGAQAGDSPCLDAGYGDVADYGLGGTTTCTDGREDGDDDSNGATGPIDMGYHYPAGYDGEGDTSISLTSFDARPAGGSIVLTWETGAEINCAGFALFREIAGTQDYKLISDLIPGQGASSSGASYSFTDNDVELGITYNYWLVDIETSGAWTAHGPASARLPVVLPPCVVEPTTDGVQLSTAR